MTSEHNHSRLGIPNICVTLGEYLSSLPLIGTAPSLCVLTIAQAKILFIFVQEWHPFLFLFRLSKDRDIAILNTTSVNVSSCIFGRIILSSVAITAKID